MLVKITYAAKKITDAILIEGRTWNRTADLLEFLKAESDWLPGEHFHEIKITDIPVDHLKAESDLLPGGQEPDVLGDGVNNVRLSENFNLREFQCKGGSCCNGAVAVDPELIRRLQAMRDEAGKPIKIVSGYRCPDHNKTVGGESNSQHLTGRAADIVISGMSIEESRNLAEKYFANGGIGYADSFTHVDTRGTKARWSY